MNPFEPVNGEKARWRYCYDLAAGRKVKEAILYGEVEDLLRCTRGQAIQAMYEARRHLEADKVCILRNVTKFGWVVEDAVGGLDLVQRGRIKAARALTRPIRKANAINRQELNQIERAQLDHEQRNLLAAQALYNRRPREVIELEAESKQRATPQLPLRKPETA